MLKVDIDANSGFCGGVIRAISTAEKYLDSNDKLFSLGSIVHNEEELGRLGALGLVPVMDTADVPAGGTVLVRAHGVPPSVYDEAAGYGLKVIDCTCPVVLKLQKDIRECHARLGGRGRVILFGKIGHPEVLGLVGQVDGDAVVVENLDQLKTLVQEGRIDPGTDLEVFSQTTKSPDEYRELCSWLESVASGKVNVHWTICSQVASRHRLLSDFAYSHDVVVFVSGKTSSNGKVLTDLCRECNPRTYQIGSIEELQPGWFRPGDSVGVSGATSTPKWLLERVASAILNLQ